MSGLLYWLTVKLFSTGSTNLFQEALILFQHIIPEVIALFVELRPFPPSHLRTFLSNFVATGVYALSLKSLPAVFFPCQQSFFLASSLFSFPCLSFFLTLFEPNSEFHPCLGEAATTLVVIQTLSQSSPQPPLATLLRGTTHPIQATQTCPPQVLAEPDEHHQYVLSNSVQWKILFHSNHT